jgi:stage V sporulation protein S
VEYDRRVTVTAPDFEDEPPVLVDPPLAVEVLRVSTGSDVKAVAGAIAGCVRRSGSVALEVIGAGALNQAVKATVVARAITIREDLDLVVTPSFHVVEIDGRERTALRLLVDHRRC